MAKPPKKHAGDGTTQLPATRRMTVIAQDPSVRRADGRILMAQIDVPAEALKPGPVGYRVQVVDYDSSSGRYDTHELPDAAAGEPDRWKNGHPSIVDDFRFHAQNAYALVMKTLARFEFALGRRVGWSFGVHQIKVAPNGMMDANAFYSKADEGLVFGYFPARDAKKKIYTCLSHDIVVHETTHALLDALRERYLDPSGPDQAAFHEGYADVIALLSVFSQVELVAELLKQSAAGDENLADDKVQPDALRKTALFGLAEEMGDEINAVRGDALRRSAAILPSLTWLDDPEFEEPHRRGEILVAAVMNGFLEVWTARLQSSKVPGQTRHAVRRVAEEGADIAAALATMWIRALDYMPPVHLEFGDALSAAITADSEVRPDDSRYGLRKHMLASFAAYGIDPRSERDDEKGAWTRASGSLHYERVRFDAMRTDKDEVFHFLWDNYDKLGLGRGAYTEVLSVRPCLRVGTDGFTLRETVAEYYQVARLTAAELRKEGIYLDPGYIAELERLRREKVARRQATLGDADDAAEPLEETDTDPVTPIYGGGVLIFDEYGKLKYHVHNDVFGSAQTQRLAYLWNMGLLRAGAERARLSPEHLSALHRQRAIGARRFPSEGW